MTYTVQELIHHCSSGDPGCPVPGSRRTQEGAGCHEPLPEICSRKDPVSGIGVILTRDLKMRDPAYLTEQVAL